MPARTYQWQWAFAAAKQSAYGTVQADGALTKSALVMGPPVVDRRPVVIPDSSQFGRGHEWSEAQEIERWDLSIPIEADLTTLIAGYIVAYGLGADTVTNPGAGAAFLHTCKPIDPASTVQQPSATMLWSPIANTGIKKKIQDLIVSSFKISGRRPERLKISAMLKGSGQWANSTASIPALTAAKFLRMKDGLFELGAFGGALTDISSRVLGFEFSYSNENENDVDGFFPGAPKDATTGAQYRGRHEIGERRKIDFSLDILHGADGTELDRLDAGTNLAIRLTFIGDVIAGAEKHTLIIDMTDVRYKAIPQQYSDGRYGYKLTPEIHYDATGGVVTPVTIKVENDQSTHL